MTIDEAGPTLEPIRWDEWARITRFLESARLAFGRERSLWTSLEIAETDSVNLSAPTGQGTYTVRLDAHLEAVSDEETLHAAVLTQSYAFAEATAAARLDTPSTSFGGIEDWGKRLLDDVSGSWDGVTGGLARAVQAAVTRNVFAHGTRTLDQSDVNRLAQAGSPGASVGDTVTLDHETLRQFRATLKSLLRAHEGAAA